MTLKAGVRRTALEVVLSVSVHRQRTPSTLPEKISVSYSGGLLSHGAVDRVCVKFNLMSVASVVIRTSVKVACPATACLLITVSNRPFSVVSVPLSMY